MYNYPIKVTVDTNVFDATKYDLSENSTLSLLRNYISEGKVKLYLSNIVLREIDAHLGKIGSKLCSKIRSNRAELLDLSCDYIIQTSELESYAKIPDKTMVIKSIKDAFGEYIKSLDPIIFDNSSIVLDDIIDDYFNVNPPFAESGEKRKEFPDAFIANQIRSKFTDEDSVVIISNDDGFKRACQKDRKYMFIDSFGELFNMINKQDGEYQKVIDKLVQLVSEIDSRITKEITANQNITVNGLSVDRKGLVSGYDYSDTYLESVNDVSHRLHVVDDVRDNKALVTLTCSADIKMNCIFEDYENSPWDSEEKEYVLVDFVHVIEKHKAHFPAHLHLDLANNDMELVMPALMLGEDSRVEREIKD